MSKALEALEKIENEYSIDEAVFYKEDFNQIRKELKKAEKYEKIILGIEDYINRRIKVEPLEDVRKTFIEIRNQLQVIKEVLE